MVFNISAIARGATASAGRISMQSSLPMLGRMSIVRPCSTNVLENVFWKQSILNSATMGPATLTAFASSTNSLSGRSIVSIGGTSSQTDSLSTQTRNFGTNFEPLPVTPFGVRKAKAFRTTKKSIRKAATKVSF